MATGCLRTSILTLLCCAVASGSPRASRADEASEAQEALRRRVEALQNQEAEEARLREEWRSRAAEHRRNVARARADLAQIESNRVKAQDGAYQGVKRSEWTRRMRQAQDTLREAEHAFDEMYEQAREADVPPGWLDDDSDDAASADD